MDSMRKSYLLDTSVFIQASRNYYALDIVPSFWEAIIYHAEQENILSIDRVKDEIFKGEDPLKTWINAEFSTWFKNTNDEEVLNIYQKLMRWSYSQSQYNDSAKSEFASIDNADAWVISYALAKNCIVSTQETVKKDAKAKIPISKCMPSIQCPICKHI
jgi:hypothetical protein